MADVKNFALNSTASLEEQIEKFANSVAFKHEKIRVMPDGHAGKGAAVGSTLTYSTRIVPNVVGVDIACRISLCALGVNVRDLPEDFFERFDKMVADRIPTGFNVRASEAEASKKFPYAFMKCYSVLKNIGRLRKSMGSLGGGNHYLELDTDDDGDVYLSIHCGSRNLGKQVCEYYQKIAVKNRDERIAKIKEDRDSTIKKYRESGNTRVIQRLINSYNKAIAEQPDDDLCYIEGLDMENYLHDMAFCNYWSELNHKVIYEEIVSGLKEILHD